MTAVAVADAALYASVVRCLAAAAVSRAAFAPSATEIKDQRSRRLKIKDQSSYLSLKIEQDQNSLFCDMSLMAAVKLKACSDACKNQVYFKFLDFDL